MVFYGPKQLLLHPELSLTHRIFTTSNTVP